MSFICAQHRKKYADLPDNELINFWFYWMQQSEVHYRQKAWESALPYIGSAFDLAVILLERRSQLHIDTNLLLASAVYLSNVFHQMAREEEADMVLLYSHSLLSKCSQRATEKDQWTEQLMDERCHAGFLAQHLNVQLFSRNYPGYALH